MTEEWKWIEGYEGLYEVSDMGQVKSYHSWGGGEPPPDGRIMKPQTPNGYPHVGLTKNGIYNTKNIHRLVLEAFVGPPPPGHECAHEDGSRDNNNLTNLSWKTQQENSNDAIRHDVIKRGIDNSKAKLTENQVLEIRRLRAEGMTLTDIASIYNVHYSNCWIICKRKTWKHI